jgi:hypothetical protein
VKLALALYFVSAAIGQERCVLEGRVVDDTTGQPLAKVHLFATQERLVPAIRTTTNEHGRFCLARLDPGSYNLFAQLSGYLDAVYQGSRHPGSYPMLKIAADSRLSPITVEMARRSILAGRVVDADRDPIAGAEVRAFEQTAPNQWRSPGNITTTDVHGAFRFYDLDPGTYSVSAAPPRDIFMIGYRDGFGRPLQEREMETFYPNSANAAGGTRIVLEPGREITDFVITMQRVRLRHLSGKVIGAPEVKSLFADVSVSGGHTILSIQVHEDGLFYQDGLLPGVYTLRPANLGGKVEQVVDLTTRDVDGIQIEPLKTLK